MTDESTCAAFEDELAELALGTLTGRERAETLAHVEACGHCAVEVEELSRVADELLQVAYEAEPPVGFEVRLLERLGVEGERGRRPRRSRGAARWRDLSRRGSTLVAAAAVIVVAAAGVSLGLAQPWAHSPAPGPIHAALVAEAVLKTPAGASAGRVVASTGVRGEPSWLFMVVESGVSPGPVTCEVQLASGHTVVLGKFWVGKGYATWSSPFPGSAKEIKTARLVDAHGATVASASFATSA